VPPRTLCHTGTGTPPARRHAQAQQASVSLSGAGGYWATRSLAETRLTLLCLGPSSSAPARRPPPPSIEAVDRQARLIHT
jgi:hypothetical protein